MKFMVFAFVSSMVTFWYPDKMCQSLRDEIIQNPYYVTNKYSYTQVNVGNNPLTFDQKFSNEICKQALSSYQSLDCTNEPTIPSIDRLLIEKLSQEIQHNKRTQREL